MHWVRTLVVAAALLVPLPASAVTLQDIIELTKAGLSDDILIAVIDADRTVFTLDKTQILELKQAGVRRPVILKMLRTRREFAAPEETTTPVVTSEAVQPQQPGLVVIGAEPAPPPVTVVVPQYYYVPFPIWGVPTHPGPRQPPQPVIAPEFRGFGRFINDGWVERR